MTISPYQVESVINAYTRQNKIKSIHTVPREAAPEGKYKDVVSLSVKEELRAEEYEKICYNIRDVILKDNEG